MRQTMTQDQWTDYYQQTKQQHDLVSVVESYGVKLRKIGSRMVAPCPFPGHRGKNKSNFNVYVNSQTYKCYGCGQTGDVLQFVCNMEQLATAFDATRFLRGGFAPSPVDYKPYIPEPAIPLDATENDKYVRALMHSSHALALWQQQGMTLETIKQYQLGYNPRKHIYCFYHEQLEVHESLTIPIFDHGELINIKHRILNTCSHGDKYRPEKKGQGASLFNIDALDMSTNKDEVLIVAGEKKVMVLQQYIVPDFLPIISATAGCENWYSDQYRERWYSHLAQRERIYIGFDPGEERAAQRTAMMFGRRAYIVEFAANPDDMCIAAGGSAIDVLDAIGNAEALRSKSVWL